MPSVACAGFLAQWRLRWRLTSRFALFNGAIHMTLKLTLAALTALLGVAATGAQATPETQAVQPTEGLVTDSARRVVRDPVTGRLRAPTNAELAAEQAAARARGTADQGPGAPLRVRLHPNGMRSAVLGPDYMVTLKAERDVNGKLVIKHANPIHEHGHAAQDAAAPASSSTAATK
jgi:hypothetical protein